MPSWVRNPPRVASFSSQMKVRKHAFCGDGSPPTTSAGGTEEQREVSVTQRQKSRPFLFGRKAAREVKDKLVRVDVTLPGFVPDSIKVTFNIDQPQTLSWEVEIRGVVKNTPGELALPAGHTSFYMFPSVCTPHEPLGAAPSESGVRVLREMILTLALKTRSFDICDPVGAYPIHALVVCNTVESLDLSMELFRKRPKLLMQLHEASGPFRGESCLHITAVNRRESLMVELVQLAVSRLEKDEVKALLRTRADGPFFEGGVRTAFESELARTAYRRPQLFSQSILGAHWYWWLLSLVLGGVRLLRSQGQCSTTAPPSSRTRACSNCARQYWSSWQQATCASVVPGLACSCRPLHCAPAGCTRCLRLHRPLTALELCCSSLHFARGRTLQVDLNEREASCTLSGFMPIHAVVANSQERMYDFLTSGVPRKWCVRIGHLTRIGNQDSCEEFSNLTPLGLAAALGDRSLVRHILRKQCEVMWVWGPVTQVRLSCRFAPCALRELRRVALALPCAARS